MVDRRLRGFFDALVVVTRLTGGRLPDDRADAGGFEGAVNFELTGPGGASWHAQLSRGGARFFRGAHPSPKATVRLATATMIDLLAGKSSWITAQMTGKVRVEGDGHAGMLFGGMLAQFRALGEKPGWRGKLARAWQRVVLS